MTKKRATLSADVETKCSCGCCNHPNSKSASTLTSKVWLRRNSSEAVSQLLAPDDTSTYTTINESELGKKTIYSTKEARPDKTRSYVNGCYCSEKPTRPKLKLKPRDIEDERPKFRRNLENRWTTEWETHGVKRIPKSYDEQFGDKERSTAPNNTEVSLNFTEKRNDYEDSKTSEHSERDMKANPTEYVASYNDRASTGKACYEQSCKCTVRDIDKESGIEEKTLSEKIRDLSRFRNSNFFETHSVKVSAPSCAPDHKCVHKFRINDRFLPEPIHCDDFGVSRCTICNKPMEQPTTSQPSTTSGSNKRTKRNAVKKIYEYNLIPPRLNIGTGKEVVEISVPQKIEKDCFDDVHNFDISKRCAPVNSFALRYQKGVI